MEFRIAMIRISNQATSKLLYKSIKDHYGFVTIKNNETYVNAFTTKPFGNFIKIADNCIDPGYKKPQFLMKNAIKVDPKIITFEHSDKAELYLMQHKEKFIACLSEINYIQ